MLIAFHWSCTGLEEVLWGFYRGLKFGDLRMAPGSDYVLGVIRGLRK